MSSVLRFLKQTPVDTQYFVSLAATVNLNIFTADAAAGTTSYVSGAAPGVFTISSVTVQIPTAGAISSLSLFRDMGVTIVSSGRTFRRVQLLSLDGGISTTNSGWSSQGTAAPGVWQPSVEGINGNAGPNSGNPDTAFSVFYFETGARGLGVANGLIRYG
jgi:hypothetical protein